MRTWGLGVSPWAWAYMYISPSLELMTTQETSTPLCLLAGGEDSFLWFPCDKLVFS